MRKFTLSKSGERKLKFLVDLGVSKTVEEWLRSEGFDVLAVRDLDPRMTDTDILDRAVQEDRLVLTMDKDFGELVFKSGRSHMGVLLLRLDEAPSDEKVAVVREVLREHSERLPRHFAVYQNGRLRIRK